ncbi:nitrite/sulfite reductase [Hydrogenophaga sp. IBVHS1]|uniref:nitrite/sulfite reductase n=1 Tax=unclassified Hydrogenophaga TaxID=2610897 RepID=UPI000A2E1A57|nr:nitrite/sulfite reductase [Hydrogenophaga sp. IBVHS1]OSZ75449.1 nitrite reductase [Hydrogenophaga sp. IBVHS1]
MYQYSEFDRQFVHLRAAQFRDQLTRWQAGSLGEDEFKPLRLQNGWYVQRFAPMLRVAVPYGEISSPQLRVLAKIARDYDHKEDHDTSQADAGLSEVPTLPDRTGHFTTRQNVQFNWIPLARSAEVMDLLASVNMHGIQTSGNCIRNITTDALAGIAADEVADPRPFAEIMRQWSTLHPEFAFLPRKFKVAITGAREDRAATAWHDVGLRLLRNVDGDLGFQVRVGGGMGRTPIIGSVLREFLPWNQILNYLEAVVRAYNRFGRRDNMYKARIKILVKAEGQAFTDQVEAEYRDILEKDGAPHTITQAELDRVSAFFTTPPLSCDRKSADAKIAHILKAAAEDDVDFGRWLQQNVKPHQNPDLRAVTLSFKRFGQAPGDATADQLDRAADLADRFSSGEARVTHEQNLLLPWVRCDSLPELWREARRLGLAKPNIGLLTDMIACPGGDFCDLANARSLPLAQAILGRYTDLDELHDLGEIDLHISGCINSCGHHHSGHIGILGVDKDGQEWYQVTLGGSDGSRLSGEATPGKVIGPSFAASEVPDVIEALLDTYRTQRVSGETFVATLKRAGAEPFKTAANAVRVSTARAPA